MQPEPQRRLHSKKNLKLNVEKLYESKDKHGHYFPVTLTAKNNDGTYQADVHDGSGCQWKSVHELNIRELGPRPPYTMPDLEWSEERGELVLYAKSQAPQVLRRNPDGPGVLFCKEKYVYTEAERRKPEGVRPFILLQSVLPDGDRAQCKVTMPAPSHAFYPLMRKLFDGAQVKHNLGTELPDEVGEWKRYTDPKQGLVFWHNTETKRNEWREPPEEAAEAMFERQLQRALDESRSMGVPRDRSESLAERERLMKRVAAAGLREVEVAQDGNCQFRSLAWLVKKNDEKHDEVRKEVVRYIQQHRDSYKDFVDMPIEEYCQTMAQPRSWGDHLTLVAASNLYSLKVTVISSAEEAKQVILPRDAEGEYCNPRAHLMVSFLAEPKAQHFNPLEEVPPPPNPA